MRRHHSHWIFMIFMYGSDSEITMLNVRNVTKKLFISFIQVIFSDFPSLSWWSNFFLPNKDQKDDREKWISVTIVIGIWMGKIWWIKHEIMMNPFFKEDDSENSTYFFFLALFGTHVEILLIIFFFMFSFLCQSKSRCRWIKWNSLSSMKWNTTRTSILQSFSSILKSSSKPTLKFMSQYFIQKSSDARVYNSCKIKQEHNRIWVSIL